MKFLRLFSLFLVMVSGYGQLHPKSLDSAIWDLTAQIESKLPQSGKKVKIAILDFSHTDGDESRIGSLLSEELISRMIKLNQVTVIERKMLDKIVKEQKLALSGLVDEQTAVRLGKLSGASLICSGTISELSDRIRVNARLIDAENGELIASASVDIQDKAVDNMREETDYISRNRTKRVGRSEDSIPRRMNSIGAMPLPRTITEGMFASQLIVYDSGLNTMFIFALNDKISIGIGENLDGILGVRQTVFYIPSIHFKFNIINDINKFSLAIGFGELGYGKYALSNEMIPNNSLRFTYQGFYVTAGYSFSFLGEDDMLAFGIRFPLLPIEAVSLLNTSFFIGGIIGISRYFSFGLAIENVYINPLRWGKILPTLSISFIPINDIDITFITQLDFETGQLSRLFSFGYEYSF